MQGLPDHAHEPTLKRISKDTLVIASTAGAAVAESLGFRNVRTLDHGQETTLGDGKLRIKATVGVSQSDPSKTTLSVWQTLRTLPATKDCTYCTFPVVDIRAELVAWSWYWPKVEGVCSCMRRTLTSLAWGLSRTVSVTAGHAQG